MRMQALLSQYVALHHEHHSMLSQLLNQLRQYGYQAEYKGPLAMEPMQLLGITQPQQARCYRYMLDSPQHCVQIVHAWLAHTPVLGFRASTHYDAV